MVNPVGPATVLQRTPVASGVGHVLMTKPITSTKGLQQSNGPGLLCELITPLDGLSFS